MPLLRSSGDGEAMQNAAEHVSLYTRADSSNTGKSSGGSKTIMIVVVIIIVVLVILLIASFFIVRRLRNRNASPKYLPGQGLKKRWRRWASISKRNRGDYSDRLQSADPSAPSLRPSARSRGGSRSTTPALEELRTRDSSRSREIVGATVDRDVERGVSVGGAPAENQNAVDRHTSVRSVMTLPAYTPSARETEQILGREGERAGIDVVLEFPETQDDEEGRREEEMESLYQIRRARRAEAQEREERRMARRAARARGDWAEVERLRIEERERRDRQERELLGEDTPEGQQRSAARLIAEHQEETARRERQRRVSSVQYASLGVARHDGSRVRAGSSASARSEDDRPLLDSAAGMGGSSEGRRGTLSTLDALSIHHRNRSASSVFSLSSAGSNEDADEAGGVYHPPFAPPPESGTSYSHERGRSISESVNSSPDFEVVSLHSTADTSPLADRSTTPRPSSRAASASRPSISTVNEFTPTISIDSEDADLSRSHRSAGGTMETPIDQPPHYEHLAASEFGPAPNYESPVRTKAPQLPALGRLPSIRVNEPSPLASRPVSQISRQDSGDMGEQRLDR